MTRQSDAYYLCFRGVTKCPTQACTIPTGFDNGILMCLPCKLMEYYQLDFHIAPSGFMRGATAEVWGDNTHEVMRGASSFWKDTDV